METLGYRATGKFKSLFLDYIEGSTSADWETARPELASFEKLIQDRSTFSAENRQTLVSALLEQHKAYDVDRTELIGKLSDTNTFTVATGHQLSVFGGPLFILNKVLTTIKLAKTLSEQYPAYNIIPVFWMASEDHDYEEVRELNLFGKTIRIDAEHEGPVGRLDSQKLSNALSELVVVLGEGEQVSALVQSLKDAYSGGNLTINTAKFWYSLLHQHDFVIIDGDDKHLKELFADSMQHELSEGRLQKAVGTVESDLQSSGYKVQAPASPVNLFKISDTSRVKVKEVMNTAEASELRPVNLSPNVVFRPLYQETILPNLAYVGGPGETAYWMQLRKGFEAFGLTMPIVWPRATVVLASERDESTLEELQLSWVDMLRDVDELVRSVVITGNIEQPNLDDVANRFIEEIKSELSDYQMDQQVEALQARLKKDVEKLSKGAERMIKAKHEKPVKQIKHLHSLVSGGLQDRSLSTVEAIAKYGESVVNHIYDAVSLEEFNIKIVRVG